MIENNIFFFSPFFIDICLSYPHIQAARNIYYQALKSRPTKDSKCVVPKSPKSLVWQHFGDNLDGQHAHCTLCKGKGKAESLKINDFSTKVLWNHQEQFPILSFMVRIVFAVPYASSKSKRVFSVARNTCTHKRASMGTDTPKDCVIVKCNLTLLREMVSRNNSIESVCNNV